MDKSSFQIWFVDVLRGLYKQKAGFPIMLITLPLLERYLRHKVNLEDQPINQAFYKELGEMFSPMSDPEVAKDFWTIYRHGLLHQVAFTVISKAGESASLPAACITFDIQEAFLVDCEGRFLVNPIEFSSTVIKYILEDYDTLVANHDRRFGLADSLVHLSRESDAIGTTCRFSWFLTPKVPF